MEDPQGAEQSQVGLPTFASRRRRLAAQVLDAIPLGALGIALGLLFFERLAGLLDVGRLVGGAIVLVYAGVLNSWIGNGQTLGQRWLKIRVVGADGRPLGLPRALARSLVLLLPIMLNGMFLQLEGSPFAVPFQVFSALCVFGLGGGLLYLFAFNWGTKQSIHDLASCAYVVPAVRAAPVEERAWWPHAALSLAWIVLVPGGLFALGHSFEQALPAEDLRAVQRSAQSVSPDALISVTRGTLTMTAAATGTQSATVLQVIVRPRVRPASYEDLADQLVATILDSSPAVRSSDQLSIAISYGYDILISSFHTSSSFSHTPGEWNARLEQKGLLAENAPGV